jgi:hypothetical protein
MSDAGTFLNLMKTISIRFMRTPEKTAVIHVPTGTIVKKSHSPTIVDPMIMYCCMDMVWLYLKFRRKVDLKVGMWRGLKA